MSENEVRATYDRETKAAYIYLQPTSIPVSGTEAVAADVSLDYDAEGNLVGIEVILP